MRHRKWPLLAAAVATVGLWSGSSASAAEPSYEELKQQVDQLRERVQTLETRPASSADTDRVVADLIADANRRSQFLAADNALLAGYDKGFFIRSEDGNFVLRPGVQVQFRHVINDSDDETDSGFEVRRLRFRFDGNAFSPDLTYSFQWDTARNGGDVTLLDAWTQYAFADQWAVKVGQFKESVFHERDISGFNQLAVDRTLVDALLGGAQTDRVQGVALVYGGNDDALRGQLALHDGANSRNTNFQDADADFGFGGRAEYKLSGNWADYKDFTAKGAKADLLIVGAGFDYTQSGDEDIVRSTLDAQWENTDGLSLYGALHGNFADGPADSITDYGALAQVGYLLNSAWEVFGRYDVVLLDDDVTDDDTFNEFTVGLNRFLGDEGAYGHRAKFTVDLVYLPDGVPSNQTGLGIVASDDEQFVVRGQFQLIL